MAAKIYQVVNLLNTSYLLYNTSDVIFSSLGITLLPKRFWKPVILSSNSSAVLKSLELEAFAKDPKYNGNTFLVYVASIPLNPASLSSK